MTKPGLSQQTQGEICQIVKRYAAQGRRCGLGEIYASLYPGHIYDPRCSSLRVTLSWLVRQGTLRRQRPGRAPAFYPVNPREG